jgi:F420-non-reducing hydrogenase small subunit
LEWLSGCEGCEVALLDSFAPLLERIRRGEAQIVYAPLLLDAEDYDIADIAILTGSVRTAADERRAKAAREKAKFLVALGSCACFGGIHGLADLQGLVDRRTAPEAPLISAVEPVWRVVKADSFIPGCPPPESHIGRFLENMLIPAPTSRGKTVCDECPRKRSEEKKIRSLRRDLAGIDGDRCLLDQGSPCIGFATSSGCGALCPGVNYPCHGCMGSDERVEGQEGGIARAISALASVLELDEVEGVLKDPVGFFMKFNYPAFGLKEAKGDGTEDK